MRNVGALQPHIISQIHNQYVTAWVSPSDMDCCLNGITFSLPSMSGLVMKKPCSNSAVNQEHLSRCKVHLSQPSGFCLLPFCLPRMKRVLQGNEQEDGGGTSAGSQETLKRPCKQRRENDLEEEGTRWECLPQEILLHIFQYLPLLDRAYASQVAK